MSPKKSAAKSSGQSSATSKKVEGFTAEEKSAMKDRVKEMKAAARRGSGADVDPEGEVLAKIAEMAASDRAMANRIHAIVKATAPMLTPRLWYGMPAYSKDDKVLCFFQSGQKFKTRYATLGFSDKSNLDEGEVWPVVFAIKELTPSAEARIAALLKKAIS
jgi:uncharacterized protein YdhG (YjbR/CyaY superfamily)